MRLRNIIITSLLLVVIVACDSKERVKAPKQGQQITTQQSMASNSHKVKVEEVIQASSYTYLRVTEGSEEYWIATGRQTIEKGSTMFYDDGIEMKNFLSKELDRTFDSIWFVGKMQGTSSQPGQNIAISGGKKQLERDNAISVEKVSGGVSIQDLFSDMKSYTGKTVSVRGEVTKFNANIMGRNWVHIQDGTLAGEIYDLTITSNATVRVGDIVLFTGKVALNKDFGAGYKYDLIIEEAVLSTEG